MTNIHIVSEALKKAGEEGAHGADAVMLLVTALYDAIVSGIPTAVENAVNARYAAIMAGILPTTDEDGYPVHFKGTSKGRIVEYDRRTLGVNRRVLQDIPRTYYRWGKRRVSPTSYQYVKYPHIYFTREGSLMLSGISGPCSDWGCRLKTEMEGISPDVRHPAFRATLTDIGWPAGKVDALTCPQDVADAVADDPSFMALPGTSLSTDEAA